MEKTKVEIIMRCLFQLPNPNKPEKIKRIKL